MRRLSPVMVIVTLVFLAGCGSGSPVVIRTANWPEIRKSDVSCINPIQVAADYYDLSGDGLDEAFLTMRCTAKTDPPGDQFEVVAGDADLGRTHPTKLVLQVPPAVVDRVCFSHDTVIYRVTTAGRSEIWQVRWSKDKKALGNPTPGPAPGCPPTTAAERRHP